MKKIYGVFLMKQIVAFLLIGFATLAQASAPLWRFEPLTATTVAVPANGTALVQYRVTNQSNRPHTLTMQPINGEVFSQRLRHKVIRTEPPILSSL